MPPVAVVHVDSFLGELVCRQYYIVERDQIGDFICQRVLAVGKDRCLRDKLVSRVLIGLLEGKVLHSPLVLLLHVLSGIFDPNASAGGSSRADPTIAHPLRLLHRFR